ncbi:diguanylate cyclase domain-containing protein [Marinobacterium aestuariivivens]|uniref:Diguanylate cyclase domain-containing protein n=1 Tax=Marinobacterium aestuariivivens TaxID=1698799 RepID=A0ABW1ZVX4_9GAMM
MRRRLVPLLCLLLVTMSGTLVTEYVAGLASERVQESRQRESLARLAELRARLESEINSVIHFTRGLMAYLEYRPYLTRAEFEFVAARMVQDGTYIRNIALAPDNVVRFVYPREGNEKVLGFDYRHNPDQWPAVREAIERQSSLVVGPVALVQGGLGLIVRTPVFVDDGTSHRYWGMASIVIDMEALLQGAGIAGELAGTVAIRGVDGLGAEGAQFFGPPGLFERPGVLTQEVIFQHSAWQLGLLPDDSDSGLAAMRVRILAYGLLLIILVLLLQLMQTFRRFERRATHDPLTGLPNRRLLLERAAQLLALSRRGRLEFCLCYIDLDGFKPVNDRFGHHAGDLVLLEVAARLRRVSRASDTVARTGGDEFVLLLPMVRNAREADQVVDKLRLALDEPFDCESQRISVGASMGWALFPSEADDLDDLMALADSRMYQVKARRKSALADYAM